MQQERGASRGDRGELVFLTPIVPAQTGNGLAMRAGLQLEALSASFTVRVAVVPVAGGSADTRWASSLAERVAVVDPVLDPAERAVAVASPLLAPRVCLALGASPRTPVHAFRSYLAPLAVALGEALESPWLTLDVDDDDEALLAGVGDADGAAAHTRLLRTFGSAFAWLSLASAEEASAVAARHGLPTVVVPNAVGVVEAARVSHDGVRLLYVGNLTYPPNVEAAEVLAREVLPRVRELAGGEARVELVGAFETGGRVEALAELDGVEVSGYLDDLGSAYRRADVVVVPLRHAAGTRIKVLEALAWGVPVVTTAAGAAGLDVEHGRHLLLGETPDELAAAAATVLADRALASSLAGEGRSLVESTYSREAVGRLLCGLIPAAG